MLILLAPFPTLQAQVGIGTNAPKARFHVADSSVLFTGPSPLPVLRLPPLLQGAPDFSGMPTKLQCAEVE